MATIESYETQKGKRYRVRYRTPERKQTDKSGFATKKAAQDFAATVEVSKLTGDYIAPAAGKVTIGELGAAWIERRTRLKASSLRTVDSAWRVHVKPKWAETRISGIRFSQVQQWVQEMDDAHGPVTVIRSFGVLAAILDEAVKDRRILVNPARGVQLPRRVKKRHVYLTHEQANRLAVECGKHAALVLLLAYCGLRWGEASALRVRDFDLLRRRVTVDENAVNVGGRIVVGTPKDHELRTLPIPAMVCEHIARQCIGKARDDLVFPNESGGYMRTPGVRSWWPGAVSRCQKSAAAEHEDDEDRPLFPRVTPHDMRHTAASLAVSAGANIKAVQRMLGHASAVMTLDTYADLFDDDLEAVATALDQAASRAGVGDLWDKLRLIESEVAG